MRRKKKIKLINYYFSLFAELTNNNSSPTTSGKPKFLLGRVLNKMLFKFCHSCMVTFAAIY